MPKANQLILFLQQRPAFLFLLPLFFILHGYTRHYDAVPPGAALLLTLLYTGIAFLLTGIGWLFYRDTAKAAFLSFFILAYEFFFGSVQDLLKQRLTLPFVSQYRFLLPFSILLFAAWVIWLKKRKKPLRVFCLYLNSLLFVFIGIDSAGLLIKVRKTGTATRLPVLAYSPCDSCSRPDIYLILLDQYAGHTALNDVFGFDNSDFENRLSSRGFHISKNSSSNYNLTPFSMASTLNMEYLGPEMGYKKHLNVSYSYRMIRNSRTIRFLQEEGYRFYNSSVFDFPGQPAHRYGDFLPYGTKLITMQTFTGRLWKDIRSDILSGKLKFEKIREKIAYEYLHFNNDILNELQDLASQKGGSPKFIYAHLMMPHWPYYFDSRGRALPIEKLSGFRNTNAGDYIEYLQYCNGRILELVDHLLAASAHPPIIMLLSDHGFRHPAKKEAGKYDFMNLNALFLPGGNYERFPDSITNVNQFRVLFNNCFNQRFPLLKDSTIDLWD